MDSMTKFNRMVRERCTRKQVPHTHAEAVEAVAVALEQSLLSERDERYADRLGEAVCLLSHLTQLRNWMVIYPYDDQSLFALPEACDQLLESANSILLRKDKTLIVATST